MYQLIQLDPPQIIRRHPDQLCGVPTRWHVADESAVRDGLAWVPVIDRPDHDPATQKLVPLPITDGIGYSVVDLTAEEIASRIPAVQGVTKLTIMRRLGDKWPTLKAILAQLPDAVQDAWTLAQEIKSDDPLFASNSDFLKQALGLTDEQFTALLTP